MKITTIQISGFRKILKATINMEDDITVIAGANNSGKTSVVELFNYVFNAKGALCSDDFPVYESQEWCTAVFPYFQAQFKQENKKDDLIANILGTIVPSENPENEMLLTPIEVLIQVDYDPANDDIRNFADYIMELDPDNSSFYFIYRFELDKDLLRKSLDSEYEKLRNQFYYDFAAEVDNIQRSIGIKVSDLKKDTYAANEEMIKEKIHTVFDRFKDNPYFQFIYGADYESYFSKPGVTKARDCLKGNTAYSILSAYKLFYVGCSRARRNLTILLDSSKIKGNLEPQKKRFEEIGFQVVSSPIH